MKKLQNSEKKLSLNKLQMAKIVTGMSSIKGGLEQNTGGGNDTVNDNTNDNTRNTNNTLNTLDPTTPQTSLGITTN